MGTQEAGSKDSRIGKNRERLSNKDGKNHADITRGYTMKDFVVNKEEMLTAFYMMAALLAGGAVGILGGLWLFS